MGFNKDAVIVAQNATAPAATLTALVLAGAETPSIEQVLDTFDTIRNAIFEGSLELAQGDVAEALPASSAPARGGRSGGRNYTPRNSGGGGNNADPGTVDFRGGKYSGKTIASVYDEDPSYLEWCVSNLNNPFMVGRIEAYLAQVA